MGELLGRQAIVTVGSPGNTATVFDSGEPPERGFRIAFSMEKTIKSSLNQARVHVWNLAEETRTRLREDRTLFQVEAGYRDHETWGTLFKGQLTNTASPRDVADRVTLIECLDGYDAVRDAVTWSRVRSRLQRGPRRGQWTTKRVGWKQDKGTAVFTVVKELANFLAEAGDVTIGDLPAAWVQIEADAVERQKTLTLPKNRQFNGRAAEFLDEYGRQYRFDWSIQNGVFQLHPWDRIWRGEEFDVSIASGMIGVPRRIDRTVKIDDVLTTVAGVSFRTNLRPAIIPGVLINLSAESEEVRGTWRAETCRYEGDTVSGPWEVECEAFTIPGGTP